jgi:predicted amidophosphoribosyltransferase
MKNIVLIPAPPRSKSQWDHARRLAQGLSNLTGFPLSAPLRRGAAGGGQKSKSAQERRELALEIDGNLDDFNGLRPVFVDDIVTTGATAQAAKVALRTQSPFTVLALYCRPLDALV